MAGGVGGAHGVEDDVVGDLEGALVGDRRHGGRWRLMGWGFGVAVGREVVRWGGGCLARLALGREDRMRARTSSRRSGGMSCRVSSRISFSSSSAARLALSIMTFLSVETFTPGPSPVLDGREEALP